MPSMYVLTFSLSLSLLLSYCTNVHASMSPSPWDGLDLTTARPTPMQETYPTKKLVGIKVQFVCVFMRMLCHISSRHRFTPKLIAFAYLLPGNVRNQCILALSLMMAPKLYFLIKLVLSSSLTLSPALILFDFVISTPAEGIIVHLHCHQMLP